MLTKYARVILIRVSVFGSEASGLTMDPDPASYPEGEEIHYETLYLGPMPTLDRGPILR